MLMQAMKWTCRNDFISLKLVYLAMGWNKCEFVYNMYISVKSHLLQELNLNGSTRQYFLVSAIRPNYRQRTSTHGLCSGDRSFEWFNPINLLIAF